jgi:hypothetical protein
VELGWCIAPALAGIVAVGVVGAVQYEWFQESDGVSFYVFAWVLFAAPFLGISGFYLAGIIGKTAVILGTLAGLAALEVGPLLVDRSIEDDPSSTAGLIHLWDPFLNSFVVSCAVALGVGLEALARAMDHDT